MYLFVCPTGEVCKEEPGEMGRTTTFWLVKGASAAERFGWVFVGKYLNILALEPLKETLEPPTTMHQILIDQKLDSEMIVSL